MNQRHKIIFFIMFCLSGLSGLAYQMIWLRKAFAVFGVITPILSVVVSVFMFGLFLGSWAGGKWIKPIAKRLSVSPIYFYATAELLIGIGGITVPYVFLWGDRLILPVGGTGSFAYLIFSGIVIAMAMLPCCVLMGATYPFLLAFLEEHYPKEKNGFSFLYLANMIGAMAGILLSSLFLIEIFGFQQTLLMAACMNFIAALLAVWMGIRFLHVRLSSARDTVKSSASIYQQAHSKPYLTRTILLITGFSSMGMEVIWVRAFTPALGTLIYSFAALLFTYLLATSMGAYLYRCHRNKQLTWNTALVIAALSISAFFPVVLNDWRIPFLSRLPILNILPFCFLLGYLTPKLIDEYSGGDPDRAGTAYAINIAGCVLGPLVASYLLLPFFGSRISLVILALPILWLLMQHWKDFRSISLPRAVFPPATAALLICSIFVSSSFEEGFKKNNSVFRHDYTATVLSYGNGLNKKLMVNGIVMTDLTATTKDMAHLPLVFLNRKPQSALMICLGMGTTLRSLASWGIDVTAVELVPSVKEAFGYYHADASKILALPNVTVIVDDGRRYLRRAEKTFDVITVDPPPPMEAAASSLLYSDEFYSLIRSRLKPDGLLQQWIPEGDDLTRFEAVVTSLTHSFPYVRMYRSVAEEGYHCLASTTPIIVPTEEYAVSRMSQNAINDRLEWDVNSETRLMEIWSKLLRGEVNLSFYTRDSDIHITDDKPLNEYFFVRYLKTQNVHSFVLRMITFLRGKKLHEDRDTTYAGAYNDRGIHYAKTNQYQRSIEDFNKAILLNTNYVNAYNNRGVSYIMLGHNKLGCQDIQKACELGNCTTLKVARHKGWCP